MSVRVSAAMLGYVHRFRAVAMHSESMFYIRTKPAWPYVNSRIECLAKSDCEHGTAVLTLVRLVGSGKGNLCLEDTRAVPGS